MITTEQWKTLKEGDIVLYSYVPPKRKRSITVTYSYAPHGNDPDWNIAAFHPINDDSTPNKRIVWKINAASSGLHLPTPAA